MFLTVVEGGNIPVYFLHDERHKSPDHIIEETYSPFSPQVISSSITSTFTATASASPSPSAEPMDEDLNY